MKLFIQVSLVLILIGCLLRMPYGYYQFMRLATCAGFLWLAYSEFKQSGHIFTLLYIVLAILFNPVIKVHLDKGTWHVIDVVVAIIILLTILFDLKKDKS